MNQSRLLDDIMLMKKTTKFECAFAIHENIRYKLIFFVRSSVMKANHLTYINVSRKVLYER